MLPVPSSRASTKTTSSDRFTGSETSSSSFPYSFTFFFFAYPYRCTSSSIFSLLAMTTSQRRVIAGLTPRHTVITCPGHFSQRLPNDSGGLEGAAASRVTLSANDVARVTERRNRHVYDSWIAVGGRGLTSAKVLDRQSNADKPFALKECVHSS